MSSTESDTGVNLSENSSKVDTGSDGDSSTSGSVCHVASHSHSFAYDDEPLAEPGEASASIPEDADGILPSVLEERSDGRMPLNQW